MRSDIVQQSVHGGHRSWPQARAWFSAVDLAMPTAVKLEEVFGHVTQFEHSTKIPSASCPQSEDFKIQSGRVFILNADISGPSASPTGTHVGTSTRLCGEGDLPHSWEMEFPANLICHLKLQPHEFRVTHG